MKTPDVDLSQVKRLLELVDSHGLDELTVEEGDLAITVLGHGARRPVVAAAPHGEAVVPEPHVAAEHAPAAAPVQPEEPEDGTIVDIVAPLVGVFYRAPSPDAPSFVDVGDEIEVGSEVGLIEAMKVFSPIPSEVAGIVIAVPADNGKLVQQGEVLVRVRLSEEA
jgi:acetyl-CoA carboxylase biotin carboxyl carrier protein